MAGVGPAAVDGEAPGLFMQLRPPHPGQEEGAVRVPGEVALLPHICAVPLRATHIHMCTHTQIHIHRHMYTCTHMCICMNMHNAYADTHAHTHAYTYTCTDTHANRVNANTDVYVQTITSVHPQTCLFAFTCRHTCMKKQWHTLVHMHTHADIYMHNHIHIYAHTCKQTRALTHT